MKINKLRCFETSSMNTRYNITFILVILISLFSRIYLASIIPVTGDAAFHSWFIQEIVNNGNLVYSNPYFLTDNVLGFPIWYPPFFHMTFSILKILINNLTIVPPILGTISTMVMYLLGKELFKNELIGLLSALMVAVHPYYILFTSTIYMESVTILELLLIIFYYLRFINTTKPKYLLLIIIFSSVSIITKQTSYIMLFPILLYHLLRFRKRSLKPILYVFVGILIISGPALYMNYDNTGIVIQPLGGNTPLDTLIYSHMKFKISPGYLEIMNTLPYSYKKINWLNSENIISFFNLSSYDRNHAKFNPILFILIMILGSTCLMYLVSLNIFKKDILYLWVFMLITTYLFLVRLQSVRYFTHLMLLILPIFVCPLAFMKLWTNKNKLILSIIFIYVILIAAMFGEVFEIYTSEIFPQGGMPYISDMNYEMDVYTFIDTHTTYTDVTMDQVAVDGLYYLVNKRFIWATCYGGADVYLSLSSKNDAEIKEVFSDNNIKYIIIRDDFVVDSPQSIMHISRDVHNWIYHCEYFKLAFSRPGIEVWEFIVGDDTN